MTTPANGWIKLHRKIVDWEWYDDRVVFSVFLHLLLTVNIEEKKWHGITVRRGQTITSHSNISYDLSYSRKTGKYNPRKGISIQEVRTAINKLKSTGEITYESTNQYSLITINNFDAYQEINTRKRSQATSDQQAINNQSTTTKEVKEVKNIRNKEEIYGEIIAHFNSTFEKQTKSYASWKANCDFHLNSYSLEDIKQAITNWKEIGWWAKEPSLELLFRMKNKNGQPCDYIDQLLNLKSTRKLGVDPLAGLVKRSNYVGN